jgi:acetolactate synthase-1/2/3 large subunit
MKITVADALLRHLQEEGVEYVFGVPVPFFAAMNRNGSIKPILTKQEEGAAFMADGYARVKGTIGARFAAAGPGSTNLVTGVAGAYMDNVPILALTGQVETSIYGKGAIQDSSKEGIDSVKMFEPITRHSSMLISRQKALKGLGAEGFRSERPGELHELLPRAVAMEKPVVIDCVIDPEEVPPLAPFLEGTASYMKTLDVA